MLVAGGALHLHSSHVFAVDPGTGATRTVVDDSVGSVVATADHLVTAEIRRPIPPHIRGRPP